MREGFPVMTDHPFEIGGWYRNRRDDYEVLSISGNKMRVRYSDGSEQTLTISTKLTNLKS